MNRLTINVLPVLNMPKPKRTKSQYEPTPFQSCWISKINKRSKHTRSAMSDAFNDAFQCCGKSEYYSPVKPMSSHGESWYIPKGLTPQKTPNKTRYTPRRVRNPRLVAKGKAPVLVLEGRPEAYSIEAHHVTQGRDSDNVFIPTRFHRGGGYKRTLHPYKESVLRPSDRKLHADIRKEVLKGHFVARQLEF
jgi:hypothetical protein